METETSPAPEPAPRKKRKVVVPSPGDVTSTGLTVVSIGRDGPAVMVRYRRADRDGVFEAPASCWDLLSMTKEELQSLQSVQQVMATKAKQREAMAY